VRVLVVTSEWAGQGGPHAVPFITEQVDSLRGLGLAVEVFPFAGRGNPVRYAAAWWRLRRGYSLASFDVVHAQFGQSGLVALPCPVPLVVTFHGSDLCGLVSASGRQVLWGRVLRSVSRAVARRADASIVVAQDLAAHLAPGVRAEVIPCGVDLDHFKPAGLAEARRALGLPESGKLVLFVGDPGNLIKDYPLAASAVASLPEALAARLIVLAGEPHERVPLFMAACDALLMTSWHEGSPMAVKEALACELPVVSTDVGDVRQRVSGVEACRICVSRAPGVVAVALAEVLHEGGRARGGRSAVGDLDLRVIAGRLAGLYERVVAARAARRRP
jgi:teichuronic acid biosynthesis glycosyltransferase TuaC